MTARWVERWSSERIAIKAWQTLPGRMQAAGLTATATADEVWIVTPTGKTKAGAMAVNEALKYIWWAQPLALLAKLPLFREIEVVVYRWIARNRYRFPGVTPYCETEAGCQL